MPLYEYHCQPCQMPFDAIQPTHARNNPVPCPQCDTPTAMRAAPTFITRTSVRNSRPGSLAEQLAGKGVMKPKGDGTTGILGHQCGPGCGCG